MSIILFKLLIIIRYHVTSGTHRNMAKTLCPAPSSSRATIIQKTKPKTSRYSIRYQPARICWQTTIHFTARCCRGSTRCTSSSGTLLNHVENDWFAKCTRTQPSLRRTAISFQRNSAGMHLSFFITDFYLYIFIINLTYIKYPLKYLCKIGDG